VRAWCDRLRVYGELNATLLICLLTRQKRLQRDSARDGQACRARAGGPRRLRRPHDRRWLWRCVWPGRRGCGWVCRRSLAVVPMLTPFLLCKRAPDVAGSIVVLCKSAAVTKVISHLKKVRLPRSADLPCSCICSPFRFLLCTSFLRDCFVGLPQGLVVCHSARRRRARAGHGRAAGACLCVCVCVCVCVCACVRVCVCHCTLS
jgi:hypothetical protein